MRYDSIMLLSYTSSVISKGWAALEENKAVFSPSRNSSLTITLLEVNVIHTNSCKDLLGER